MFRFVMYFKPNKDDSYLDAIRMDSEPFDKWRVCNGVLEVLSVMEGFTGGHIEQFVNGIGWVNANEGELS